MKNRNGLGTLFAIFALIIVTIIGVSVQFFLGSEEKRQKTSRVKFEMARIESLAQFTFSKPQAYTSCLKDPQNQLWSCTILPQQIDSLKRVIYSGPTCGSNFCGITATANVIPHSTKPKVKFKLSYIGTDVKVSDSVFEIEIPSDALNGSSGVCGIDKDGNGSIDGYLYKGIDSAGNNICDPLPTCSGYTYFSGLNANGTAKCESLTNNLSFDANGKAFFQCGNNQYIKGLSYDPTSNFVIKGTCEPQLDICKIADDKGNPICPPKGY